MLLASAHSRQQPEKRPAHGVSPGWLIAPTSPDGRSAGHWLRLLRLSERHHPQCSPRPSAPESPAHNGQHWRRLPGQATATGKELSIHCPERGTAAAARWLRAKSLQGFDNLSWAIHPPGEFAKGSANICYHWGSNEDAARARRGASERAGMQEAPAATAPSSHPEAGAGKAAPASQEEQWPHPIPPRAASRFHPAEDKACGPRLACGGPGARGRILRGERGCDSHPPAGNHRCPCAPTGPAAAETMRAMLAGSRGGRGHRAPQRWLQEWGAGGEVGGPQP